MVANTWYTPPPLTGPGRVNDGRAEVGVVAPNYGLEHLSYLMQVPGYRHVQLRRFPFHRLEKQGTFWDKTPVFLRAPVPLVHTFNHLPMNGPPFVLSFESELPFYLGQHRNWQHTLGHRLLASDRCRALLAMSDTAGELAKRKFTDLGLPEIVSKIQTFRGAVLPSIAPPERTYSAPDAPLKLIFVGADGLRKGAVPLFDAIEALRQNGAKIELTVVSSMMDRSYAIVDAAAQSHDLVRRMAAAPWVTHHPSLPYAEVRALMGKHDMLAFPTLDETLGWVVIEAAMEGMATLGTNAFALPELVEDGATGRIISLPLTDQNRWEGLFKDDRAAHQKVAYDIIRTGLMDALTQILNDRSVVPKWGAAARDKLAGPYDPDQCAARLAQIYDQAQTGVVRAASTT